MAINGLRQTPDKSVIHGNIREVSLVLAGANIGAYIETLDVMHSDDPDQDEEYEAVIFSGEDISLNHSDDEDDKKKKPKIEEIVTEEGPDDDSDEADDDAEDSDEEKEASEKPEKEEDKKPIKHADDTNTNTKEEKDMPNSEKTVQDVFNELTEEQKQVVYFMIGEALKSAGGSDDEAKQSGIYDDEEDALMHTNVFEDSAREEFLAHVDLLRGRHQPDLQGSKENWFPEGSCPGTRSSKQHR